MKKLVFVFMMAVAFAACEGPMGPRGYDGEPGRDGIGVFWAEDFFEIRPNEWQVHGSEGSNDFYLFCEREWNLIDNSVVDHGAVIGYIYEEQYGEYFLLPHVIHQIDDYEWSQTISLGFSRGRFTITLRNTDLMAYPPDNTLRFRLVVLQNK